VTTQALFDPPIDPQPAPPGRADDRTLSPAERARMPRAIEVLEEIATNHGVCIHPLPVRRVDRQTGEGSAHRRSATDLVVRPTS
jgi:hypothetical protein